MIGRTDYYPHFFTATILEWRHLLRQDKYKDIIIESLRFLVEQKRVAVYAFVIMPNHIHLLWHICEGHKREDVQRDFLKYTAQCIKADLNPVVGDPSSHRPGWRNTNIGVKRLEKSM